MLNDPAYTPLGRHEARRREVPTAGHSPTDANFCVTRPPFARAVVLLMLASLTDLPAWTAVLVSERGRSPMVLNAAMAASHGFDLTTCLIPRKEIRAGGPPKDGIPALTRPPTVPGRKARRLDDADRVIGIFPEQTEQGGTRPSVLYTFWFSWQAMHPRTSVFSPP